MEFLRLNILTVFLATLITGAVIHHPKVTEENNDSINEDLKKPFKHQTHHSAFNPTPFTYQTAAQQDYLRQRYAEQQQINVEEIGKLRRPISKNIQRIYQQSTLEHDQTSEPYDWQPFLPKTRRNSKQYIPLLIKTDKSKRENKQEIDRKDESSTSKINGQIIYIDPRILKRVLELKNKQKQIESRSISIEQGIEVEPNSLNELVNKNPHVKLDTLKRILEEYRLPNKLFPAIRGPEPFQQQDYTPITERTKDVSNHEFKPNIQVDNDHSLASIIPQQGKVVTKEDFEKIQKQLEESSKYQVHDALERAQQAAQAHVEAQHKAIEQAQRAILENVQKQLENVSPQSLRLVQEQFNNPNQHNQQLEDAPQALKLVQDNIPEYLHPTPLPEQLVSPAHDVTVPSSNVQIHSYKATALPEYISNSQTKELVSERPHLQIIKFTSKLPKHFYVQQQEVRHSPEYAQNIVTPEKESFTTIQNIIPEQPQLKIVRVTQVPKHFYVQPKIKQEHYAPNHIHQALVQKQAEKVLLDQVQSHNNAIINGKKGPNRYIDHSKNEDKEAHGSAKAYQRIVLKSNKQKHKDESDESESDEHDDLQYAAKYAFGYRIKDNKEGNDFGHEEKRSGRSAEGSYQVLLPDGRRQKVEYYADDTGYHAKVTYENEATHK